MGFGLKSRVIGRPISRVLSRTIIYLDIVSPQYSSNRPEFHTSHILEFLFGFAPSGVCRAFFVAKKAVRSYRTVSPLPCGGLFSVALSVRLLCPVIIWHFALWSPDFPHLINQARLPVLPISPHHTR